ncbi:lysozyme-like protein [Stereum hirsutum FP-91666 SS1]|uniref:lysozyme-like protein n=1 Tax=Stereum hirsutum (strain FP-91666) TaxID=721885 RepID=UPI0004449ED7|nr:lysozyme-like protein [Stereum hirsutum FP-91666 SS1]EIM82890.1 lysozyme-like protein [Stereum hirsutum FP-91666 SS1]
MKFSGLLALVLAAVAVEANLHAERDTHGGHAQLARRLPKHASKQKRCKVRSSAAPAATPIADVASTPSSSWVDPAPSSSWVDPAPSSTWVAPTSSSVAPVIMAAATPVAGAVAGLISVVSNTCGASGATTDITATSGPNGAITWLNCGLDGSGWNPPYIQVSDLISADLGQSISTGNSPFNACSDYVDMFYQYAEQNGLPPILLASFAMQESSCNPGTVGGAGEQGLMQLTKDKCYAAPGGNCQDPNYNIMTGAKFIADTLQANGGDVLKTIGAYNGWSTDLTLWQATAAASTSCCRCQNNLDYLHQFLNGWMQGVDAYTNVPRLGQYFNLDQC